jgi:hypothetical protein
MRLFQNFSFWNSFLEFSGKTGLLTGFSESLSKTNRVLEQAHIINKCFWRQQNEKDNHFIGVLFSGIGYGFCAKQR